MPTSTQSSNETTAALNDCNGARGEDRTHTALPSQRILSPFQGVDRLQRDAENPVKQGVSVEPTGLHCTPLGDNYGYIDWTPILGTSGRYEVNSAGYVRSMPTRRILKPERHTSGYLRVQMHLPDGDRREYVHALVLEAFVCSRPAGMQAAHGDGDRHNNRLPNLRWVEPIENTKDKEAHGTIQRGEQCHRSKLTRAQVDEMRRLYGEGVPRWQINRKYPKISDRAITDVLNHSTWR